MIYLGVKEKEKKFYIKNFIKDTTDKVFILTTCDIDVGDLKVEYEIITFKDLIEYAYYYKIIEQTTKDTVIIINEPLFTSNRSDLTYNCIRVFLNSTDNIKVFSYLPILNTAEDFTILLDFVTKSKYKQTKLKSFNFDSIILNLNKVSLTFNFDIVETTDKDKEVYTKIKEALIIKVDKEGKNPDVIPRELQLKTAKFKKHKLSESCKYLFRNDRYKLENSSTYRNIRQFETHIIFDIPFNNSDLIRFLRLSKQTEITAVISDLPIDIYFQNKINTFKSELEHAYSKI